MLVSRTKKTNTQTNTHYHHHHHHREKKKKKKKRVKKEGEIIINKNIRTRKPGKTLNRNNIVRT